MSEHLSHDNPYLEDEHFSRVIANALINAKIEPTPELCKRWLAEDYVNEYELELILEAYENAKAE